MESVDRMDNYLVLLKIRQKAYRRNMLFAGGLFVLTILLTTGSLLLMEWNPRSVYLMAFFDFMFAVSFVMAWARLEITKESIDLVNNLMIRN